MLSPLLAAILGSTGQAAPQGQPVPAPAPVAPAEDPGPDIQVQNKQINPLLLKSGILHGGFGVGHTGGNILGALGDAFLIQAGKDPIYAPRLQQAREAEALRNYGSDPQTAIDQLTQVNPGAALHQYDVLNDNQRQQQTANDQHQVFKDQYENNTKQRALSLLSSATDQASWTAAKKRVLDYYNARGVAPDFDIPDTYDPEAQKAISRTGIPVTEQNKLSDADAYRQAVLALNVQKANDNRAYRNRRADQFDTALGYQGQKTEHTVNAPRTPAQIKGVLAEKVANGLPLSPSEQKAWGMLNPPKGVGKAPPISAVRQPDGSYVIKKN